MKLYSYLVARDYGFAPNPFFGFCTLATCKPVIRRVAEVGDWIIGTGSARRRRSNYLVFAMLVSETMSFNEYWSDPRFRRKKPNMRGSLKQAFGDNIYRQDEGGRWHQLDSHHSYVSGAPNPHNIKNDTQTDRVLIGCDFAYLGGNGPQIPDRFRNTNGFNICAIRGHKCRFSDASIIEFLNWFRSHGSSGYAGEPIEW